MGGTDTVLDEGGVDPDPFVQFGRWFEEAADVLDAPEAMAVATADADGRPSVRMVLLKSWDPTGFTFFTNYDSRKAQELAVNPRAALLFHWEPLGRQVRIEGATSRVGPAASDEYFATRPLGSQIGAYASHQSRTVPDRATLDAKAVDLATRFGDGPVPRPPWWGGYRVTPEAMEFWQLGRSRMHDRLRYLPDGAGWRIDRLQP
jgi:pyridoxamine 5'-phosphate oxidase